MLLDGNFAVSYSAVYVDVKLVSIKAQWKDVVSLFLQYSTLLYESMEYDLQNIN